MNLHLERLKAQMALDRRTKHLRRWWYDVQDDLGEGVAAGMAFVLTLLTVGVLFFLGLGIDELIKRWYGR